MGDLHFVIFQYLLLHPVKKSEKNVWGTLAYHNFGTPTAKELPFEVELSPKILSLPYKYELLPVKTRRAIYV